MKTKTVLFFPGFKSHPDFECYDGLREVIKALGYQLKIVDTNWNRTTIKDWTADLEIIYKNYDPSDIILAGFSFGAMTALVAASKRAPSELWLFSLSPFFIEDLTIEPLTKSQLKFIGINRERAFRALSFRDLVSRIPSKTKMRFFYGQNELKYWSNINYRHRITGDILSSETTIIPNAQHDISSSAYLAAIEESLKY